MKKQIIAIGGNTLLSLMLQKSKANPLLTPDQIADSLVPHDFRLENYLFEQTGKTKPRICFLATASGDRQIAYDLFYAMAKKMNCTPAHLSLFAGSTPDLRSVLLNQDLIYVGGGNTRNLLTLWKDWGVDQLMREAYDQGTVLAGWSAGSICWFEQGVTDSIPGSLTSLTGLGFLKGSNCPHYDGEKERRPSYHRLILEGKIQSGVAADDGVGLHYRDGKLVKVYSANPGQSKAFSVALNPQSHQIVETVLIE